MLAMNTGVLTSSSPKAVPGGQEVRCAVRFPLQLPVLLTAGLEEFAARTCNISASGVLITMDRPLRVKRNIQFSMRMPGGVLGSPPGPTHLNLPRPAN